MLSKICKEKRIIFTDKKIECKIQGKIILITGIFQDHLLTKKRIFDFARQFEQIKKTDSIEIQYYRIFN